MDKINLWGKMLNSVALKTVIIMVAVFLLLIIPEVWARVTEPIILTASWYSIDSLKKEGQWKITKGVMANGKIFDENAFTCASNDYPFKTKLKITNIKNPKKSVIVEVTDRTNKRFKGKRIDLSKKAFSLLASLSQGLVSVKVEIIK